MYIIKIHVSIAGRLQEGAKWRMNTLLLLVLILQSMGSIDSRIVQMQDKSETGSSKIPAENAEKPKCKACCACPETKKRRDECIIEKGQEHCSELIEEHKECMRKMGFNI